MRRHDFDALSFTFGLLFAVVGLALLGGSAVRDGLSIPLAGPVVAAGLAITVLIAARPRAKSRSAEADAADSDAAGA